MRQLNLWRVEMGRSSTMSILVGAPLMEDAVLLAVEWLKDYRHDWKGVNRVDISSIKRMGETVILADEKTKEGT